MKRIYLYIYLLLTLSGKTQNLVPNPSFETYTTCPNGTGGQIGYAVPWVAATATSSTDYFNACSSASTAGVPYHQGGGFQYARTGNSYAGLFFRVGSGAREYLQVQLTTPLSQNISYYVEFYVNSTNVSWISSSCNNIAANFSVIQPFNTAFNELSLSPHIMNPGNPIINDTLNWVKVSGCYLAQGGEEYLTIGNFFNNANTQITAGSGAAYYYVDDVLVEEITGNCTTGINELSISDMKLFPNPTNEMLNVKLEIRNDKELSIRITDLVGREIKQLGYKEEINVSDLEKGIYFLSLYQHDQLLTTKKVVKE